MTITLMVMVLHKVFLDNLFCKNTVKLKLQLF
jgi:hypothetical protein